MPFRPYHHHLTRESSAFQLAQELIDMEPSLKGVTPEEFINAIMESIDKANIFEKLAQRQ